MTGTGWWLPITNINLSRYETIYYHSYDACNAPSGKIFRLCYPERPSDHRSLIALHKAVKKDEDQALKRVATSFGEQSLVAKGAIKFNDVRTTLDTKLDNAHSYLVLAGAISSTATRSIS